MPGDGIAVHARACVRHLNDWLVLPQVPHNGPSAGRGGGKDVLHLREGREGEGGQYGSVRK